MTRTFVVAAWDIQRKELLAAEIGVLSLHNEMLLFLLIETLAMIAVGFFFGGIALLCFVCAALVGILLLESVNYIEHYGLRRKPTTPGVYERVQPWHSWNSDHLIGRLVLYELTRHSDHHYQASRKYQILRHMEEAPQLPAGYPAMIILSLCPPLYFKIMNPRVQKLLAAHAP